MTQNSKSCMGGWTSDLLLAYLEGDLPAQAASDLEAHLEVCPACSRMLTDLRHMDHLLKRLPEAFHPSSEQLWHYARQGHDPDGLIAVHMEACALCRQDVDVLREMAAVGAGLPEEPRAMPLSLRARLEELYPREQSAITRVGWVQGALEQFRAAFRFPVLAVGTAAALVIVAVLCAPVWWGRVQITIPEERQPSEQIAPLPGSAEPQFKQKQVQRHEALAPPQEATHGMKADQSLRGRGQYGDLEKGSVTRAEVRKEKKSAEVSGAKLKESTAPRLGVEPLTEREAERDLGEPPAAPVSRAPAPVKRALQRVAPSSPGSVESARARPQSPIPVEVRIVDGRGETIPWMKFTPSAVAADRYRFLDRDGDRDREGGTPENGRIVPHGEDRPYPGYIVVVAVHESGEGLYELRAALLQRGGREIDSLAESGIRKEELSHRVNKTVSTLLGIH